MKFLICILLSLPAFAIDFIEPTAVCERYLTKKEQDTCAVRVKKMAPDYYLAAVCNQMTEDNELYACLGVSAEMDPKKLDKCFDASLSDSDRMTCVKGVAGVKADSFQRMPASKSK